MTAATRRPPQIVAMGGGGFSMEPENPLLDDFVLSLAGVRTPRVLFVPTASGDSADYVTRFHRAFADGRAEPSHLALFERTVVDLRAHLLAHDVIYVGGGNTVNMLAIWRAQGLDVALHDAWRAGVVIAGVSAGAVCWFEAGVTDSYGRPLRPLAGGLGWLAGSMCPHYDYEPDRRPTYQRLLSEGLPAGYAADDGAALHFVDTSLVECVASRPAARGYRVSSVEGEAPLTTRYLGTL